MMGWTKWIAICGIILGMAISQAWGMDSASRVSGLLILQLAAESPPQELEYEFARLNGIPTLLQVNRSIAPAFGVWSFSYDPAFPDPELLLRELQNHPFVRIAQFDHRIQPRTITPQDPFFDWQWHLKNTGGPGQQADADIDADLGWELSTGGVTSSGDTIVIAQIDDGTSLGHPDLQQNVWRNFGEIPDNGIDDDGNGYVDDYRGWNVAAGLDLIQYGSHGIQVHGVLAASTDNNLGVSGVGWNSQVMHVVGITHLESEALEAFYYVWNARKTYNETQGVQGAFVVALNASWGVNGGQPGDFPLWCGFIDSLGQQGILTVAATANEDWNIDEVGDIPTACGSEYLIAVTATDARDERTFSAWGPEHIDLGAPGDSIYTTQGADGYGWATGTSFAAPQVSGSIGLLYGLSCPDLQPILQQQPAATASYMRGALLAGVDVVPDLEGHVRTEGRLNIGNSLALVNQQCGACPSWSNLELQNLQSTNALLRWTFLNSPDSLFIRWQTSDSSGWILESLPDTTRSFELAGLPVCEAIAVQLVWHCQDVAYVSNTLHFVTGGCCQSPSELFVENVQDSGFEISWPDVASASGYLVYLRPIGTISWAQHLAIQPELSLTDLQPCFPYEVQVIPVCQGNTAAEAFTHIIQTGGCNSCTGNDYCIAGGQSGNYEWIETVQIDNFTHPSGPNQGYADFTGVPIPLTLGVPHVLGLTPGSLIPDYWAHWKVWIDLDQDGQFDDPGECIFATEDPKSGTTFHPFTLPSTASTGVTRMRIAMTWEEGSPLAPCDPFPFGEVEDYCVYITAQNPTIDCPAPPAPQLIQSNTTSLEVNWTPADHDFGYLVRWRAAGHTQWHEKTVPFHTVKLKDLEPCTSYELAIQRICLSGLSGYGPVEVFSTECAALNTAPSTGLDANPILVYPNPSSGQLWIEGLDPTGPSVRCRLVSASGNVIGVFDLASSARLQLHLPPEISPGLYFLDIQQGEQKRWIKILKG